MTWAVSPPVGCYRLQPPSPFIIITQPKSWYSFTAPRRVEGWVVGVCVQDAGVVSLQSMVGGPSTSILTSSPAGLPAIPNISLLQPSMLSASLLQGLLTCCQAAVCLLLLWEAIFGSPIYVCMFLCMYLWMYIYIYVSMYLSVYVFMYLCMYLCVYIHIFGYSKLMCWWGCMRVGKQTVALIWPHLPSKAMLISATCDEDEFFFFKLLSSAFGLMNYYIPCRLLGGAGVLPPASNTSAAVHVSPGKKQRGGGGAVAISAPSTTAVPQVFSVPLMPNTVPPHSLATADALSYFSRPSESLEQMQRNQLLQRQMLLAAGQQLTPVICHFWCQ